MAFYAFYLVSAIILSLCFTGWLSRAMPELRAAPER